MPTLTAVLLSSIFDAEDIEKEYSTFKLINYDSLLTELDGMQTVLLNEPEVAGILKLNGIIAQIDAQKTRASTILSTAIRNDGDLEALYKRVTALYKREYDTRLPQPPVSDFTNAPTREAACNALLLDVKTLVSAIEGSYSRAKTFTKLAANALAKLDSTNKNISRQITVLQLGVEIGEIARSGNNEKHTF